MTSRDFCYFLQGFLETSNVNEITQDQLVVIRNHLNMVFKHEIDPSYGDLDHQKVLSDIHQGKDTFQTMEMSQFTKEVLEGMKLNC